MPEVARTRTLNDGTIAPLLAFGVATVHNGRDSTPEILRALQKGFRHIDTARLYGNEQCVGRAIAQWEGGTRKDLFIQGEWCESVDKNYEHDPERSLMKSLELLGTDHIDLYLIHNLQYLHPLTLQEAWAKMEDLLARGLVKSIGISAFPAEEIEELSKVLKIKPSVNQVEYHPYLLNLPRTLQMMDTCKKYDIAVEPFTTLAPLTRWPGGLAQEASEDVAVAKGISATQVLLVWARQMTGGPVITTCRKEEQYHEILDTDEITLTEVEMEVICQAGRDTPQKRQYSTLVWNDVDGEGSLR